MDEKTEQLRDIFMDVAEDGTVTESQEEGPGSLTADEEGVDRRLAETVGRLRERFGVGVDLDDEVLATVVRRFYDGDDDAAVADAVGVDRETVVRARADLHLFRDDDLPEAVGDLSPDERTVDRIAEETDVDRATAERYRRFATARAEARGVSYRFQGEYEDALADAGLAAHMTAGVREDGLDEATEDIGSLEEDADVDF